MTHAGHVTCHESWSSDIPQPNMSITPNYYYEHALFLTDSPRRTNLRSYKVGSVAGGHQESVLRSQLLRKTKVYDSKWGWLVRLIAIHDIAGLQISVGYLQWNCYSEVNTITNIGGEKSRISLFDMQGCRSKIQRKLSCWNLVWGKFLNVAHFSASYYPQATWYQKFNMPKIIPTAKANDRNRMKIALTPSWWRKLTVLTTVYMISAASRSLNACASTIWSSNSPPCINSNTMYTWQNPGSIGS